MRAGDDAPLVTARPRTSTGASSHQLYLLHPPPSASAVVIMEGALKKRGATMPVMRDRYCVATWEAASASPTSSPSHNKVVVLRSYKSKAQYQQHPEKPVSVHTLKCVSEWNGKGNFHRYEHAFTMETNDDKLFHCSAPNADDKQRWVDLMASVNTPRTDDEEPVLSHSSGERVAPSGNSKHPVVLLDNELLDKAQKPPQLATDAFLFDESGPRFGAVEVRTAHADDDDDANDFVDPRVTEHYERKEREKQLQRVTKKLESNQVDVPVDSFPDEDEETRRREKERRRAERRARKEKQRKEEEEAAAAEELARQHREAMREREEEKLKQERKERKERKKLKEKNALEKKAKELKQREAELLAESEKLRQTQEAMKQEDEKKDRKKKRRDNTPAAFPVMQPAAIPAYYPAYAGGVYQDKAFNDVVRAIDLATTDAQRRSREYTLTFADVFSRQRRADGSVAPKLKTVGKAVLAAQRAKGLAATLAKPQDAGATVRRLSSSSSSQPKMASILNGNASPKVSKWSSVLTAVSTQVKANQADALAADLQRKSADLEQQVRQLKVALSERDREREDWDKQKAAWEAERQQLAKDLASTTTTPPPVPTPRASFSGAGSVLSAAATIAASEMSTIREAVAKTGAELVRAQRDLEASVQRRNELETTLAERDLALDKLRHENEALVLQSKELRLEHDDMRRHVEELHSRLVETQRLHNESTEQLATLRRQQTRERELLTAVRSEMDATSKTPAAGGRRRSSVTTLLEVAGDSETLALVKRLVTERDALKKQSDEQQIELSCHEATHEKEKLVLSQFKEQLARGFVVTKYSTNGKKSQRMLYSDPQCRWISWRKPSDVINASSTAANGTVTAPPRADAKAETLDLVAVFHGVKTENLQAQRPAVPSRCLSLVFVQPCRSLDFEVESRERSLTLVRGFRLLLDEVNERRQQEEP
ncbi:hypothetical protein ATCC90586_010152 [Pythium insidiosum]|nr:hypothetical protein ATCC90586_010152 [Pythium insidiosum]